MLMPYFSWLFEETVFLLRLFLTTLRLCSSMERFIPLSQLYCMVLYCNSSYAHLPISLDYSVLEGRAVSFNFSFLVSSIMFCQLLQ